jgi:hypothetical protein
MPKGKKAAALFEVIHAGRRSSRSIPAAQALRTPGWWFKRSIPRTPTVPRAAVAPTPDADDEPRPTMSGPAERLKLNADSHEISLRVSYTHAIIACFTVVVVVALSYLVGRHIAGPPAPVSSASSAQLQQGPARGEVMEVSAAPQATSEAVQPAVAEPPLAAAQVASASSGPDEGATPPTRIVDDAQRISGMQYMVVQSYPQQEEVLARAAVDALQQNSIDATMIKGLRGYVGPNWFAVVGTKGFERTLNSPEYDDYLRKVMDVSNRFAGTAKFKRFEPRIYTWRPQQ